MSVTDTQSRVQARIWQAIAQSGVNVSAIPQSDLDRLVSAITATVLQELDDLLGEATGQPASAVQTPVEDAAGAEGELTLWEGRPFLSLSTKYSITNERVRIVEGILGKDREDIELVRIQDIDHKQGLGERMANIGDITIRSHDPSDPEVVLSNVANPLEVHEILRRAVLNARTKHRLTYREEM